MIESTAELTLEVSAEDRASMERELAAAETVAREKAMEEGSKGILVTRTGSTSFTVSLSDDVPFGLTQERHAW